MGRRLRYIPEGGALVEVTCRTLHSRFLLRPSPELNEIIVGVLGRAQRLYEVRCCGYVFLSNHYHLLLDVDNARQLARFMAYLNSNLAREAGRLHGWQDKIWSRRYQAILVSGEEGAQIARLKYVLANGCKEDLVERPQDWPGVHTARALIAGEALTGSGSTGPRSTPPGSGERTSTVSSMRRSRRCTSRRSPAGSTFRRRPGKSAPST